jgi:hypothetical protein
MSRKHVVHGYKMFNAVNSAVTQTSNPTNVEQIDKVSIHCTFSASSNGTFTVQARNGSNDGWYALDFGVALTIASETDVQISLKECPFSDIRLIWTPSSSSGTLTASLSMKSVGA